MEANTLLVKARSLELPGQLKVATAKAHIILVRSLDVEDFTYLLSLYISLCPESYQVLPRRNVSLLGNCVSAQSEEDRKYRSHGILAL